MKVFIRAQHLSFENMTPEHEQSIHNMNSQRINILNIMCTLVYKSELQVMIIINN